MEDKTDLTKTDYVNKLLNGFEGIDDSKVEEILEEQVEQKREARAKAFITMVPKRYRNITFSGNPKLLTAQRSVIYGPYGTGKTYLGYGIAKELFVAGKVFNFTAVRERELYNNMLAYRDKPHIYKDLYYDVDLLIIDEFGKNSQTDASSSHIFNIIDYRYDWELRTILICNATNAEELRQIIPEAIQDRFVGSTHLLSGESRRVVE